MWLRHGGGLVVGHSWGSVPQETTSLFPTEQAMDHNQDRQTVFRESQARAQVLSKEVRHLREEKSKQVRTMLPLAAGPCPVPAVWTKSPPQPPGHGRLSSL